MRNLEQQCKAKQRKKKENYSHYIAQYKVILVLPLPLMTSKGFNDARILR